MLTLKRSTKQINNRFYDDLGHRWFDDDSHAIALLRAEVAFKTEYVDKIFTAHGLKSHGRIVDTGCGAGLVTIPLAHRGWRITGYDVSASSLQVARDRTPKELHIQFIEADAYHLPIDDTSHDGFLLLDILEHVDRPDLVIREASRILKKNGHLIFYTFNRTPLAWLLAIKGIKWVTRDCPKDVHIYEYFIKPHELDAMMTAAGLKIQEICGVRPVLGQAFWRSLLQRRVDPEFAFTWTSFKGSGFIGYATKT